MRSGMPSSSGFCTMSTSNGVGDVAGSIAQGMGVPVREHDQVSARNCDFLFLAFDLEPAPSPGNRVKTAGWFSIHTKCPRPAEIRSTVDGAANVQMG